MKKLNENWITEGTLDFEYKKYILLAYLKEVCGNFDRKKLYPFLSDLVFHYNNLLNIKEKKELATQNFPKKIDKINLKEFTIQYEKLIEDEEYMETIEEIVNFAIPKVQEHLREGKELYELVEQNLNIFPVGIVPLRPEEGYLFLRDGKTSDVQVFEYQVTIFENIKEKFRGIRTKYITSYMKSISNTFESIKLDLVRNYKAFPNPATYVVESLTPYPMEETFLPVAKRSLIRYLSEKR